MSKALQVLTAEFLAGNKNGGRRILARSTWVAVLLFAVALMLLNLIAPGSSWSLAVLRALAAEHFSWLGAIWGGTYLSLYGRFASQWSYLAGQYNKILELEATGTKKEDLAKLKHAFLVDADALHMLRKDIFLGPARRWILEDDVVKWFIEQNDLDEYRRDLKKLGLTDKSGEPVNDCTRKAWGIAKKQDRLKGLVESEAGHGQPPGLPEADQPVAPESPTPAPTGETA